MGRVPVVRPSSRVITLGVGRIGVDADDHLRPRHVAVGERRCRVATTSCTAPSIGYRCIVDCPVGSCSRRAATCRAIASSDSSRTKSARQYHCVARRVERVERGLDRRERHSPTPCISGVPTSQHRRDRLLRVRRRRRCSTRRSPHTLLHVQLLRERRHRRHRQEREEAVQLARRPTAGTRGTSAAPRRPARAARTSARPSRSPPGERGTERGDDAEVAAAAAQRPEQIGVLVRARGDRAAVGQHHVGLEQVVDRQPVLARLRWPMPPPSVSPPTPVVRDDRRSGSPSRTRASPRRPRPRSRRPRPARCARRGSTAMPLHRRQVDHDAVVDGAEAAAVVAAAADGERQAVLAARSSRPRPRRRPRRRSARSAPGAGRSSRCRRARASS